MINGPSGLSNKSSGAYSCCPFCSKNIVIHASDKHKKECSKIHCLAIELGFFDQHREEWFGHHPGKFVLIKGVAVHGFYDTMDRAYEVGCHIWGDVPFLIKEVLLIDRVNYIPTIFEVRALRGHSSIT